MTAEEFGYPDIQKQVKQTLKDTSVVNSTRWKVYDVLCNMVYQLNVVQVL